MVALIHLPIPQEWSPVPQVLAVMAKRQPILRPRPKAMARADLRLRTDQLDQAINDSGYECPEYNDGGCDWTYTYWGSDFDDPWPLVLEHAEHFARQWTDLEKDFTILIGPSWEVECYEERWACEHVQEVLGGYLLYPWNWESELATHHSECACLYGLAPPHEIRDRL